MIDGIPVQDSDDPVFLAALNALLADLVAAYRPGEVHLIRIDRWFDHKWLKFSGKGRVAFDGWPRFDTALDVFWREKLTFPPFTPNRVLEQISFERVDDAYRPMRDARAVHRPARSHSAKNLHRRVADFTQSGLFVWFSSDTAELEHASLMSYAIEGDSAQTWFASFRRKGDCWTVHRVKGVDEAQVQARFTPHPEDHAP